MSAEQDSEIEETPAEARRNRGTLTVFEQTVDGPTHDEGDRYVSLGYETQRHKYDEDESRFVSIAVAIAHIELPEPIEEGDLEDWLNSDIGKLALSHFFEGIEVEGVVTEWGFDRLEGWSP